MCCPSLRLVTRALVFGIRVGAAWRRAQASPGEFAELPADSASSTPRCGCRASIWPGFGMGSQGPHADVISQIED